MRAPCCNCLSIQNNTYFLYYTLGYRVTKGFDLCQWTCYTWQVLAFACTNITVRIYVMRQICCNNFI